jgi:hypothetical protein
MKRARLPPLCAAALFVLAGCATAPADPAARISNAYYALIEAPDDMARQEALWRALVDGGACDANETYCVVEGHIRLAKAQLVEEVRRRSNAAAVRRQIKEDAQKSGKDASSLELTLNYLDDEPDIWPPDRRGDIGYFVDRASFDGMRTAFGAKPQWRSDHPQTSFESVRRSMSAAIESWNNACLECGVGFVDLTDAPAAARESAYFRVAFDPFETAFARAFYPNAAIERRRNSGISDLLIGPVFFGEFYDEARPGYGARQSTDVPDANARGRTRTVTVYINQTGVLRHELGHALGYRHEFATGASFSDVGKFETSSWCRVEGTSSGVPRLLNGQSLDEAARFADPASVMMYPCAFFHYKAARRETGEISPVLEAVFDLSDCDEKLHRAVYLGDPVANVVCALPQ